MNKINKVLKKVNWLLKKLHINYHIHIWVLITTQVRYSYDRLIYQCDVCKEQKERLKFYE